MKGVYLVAGVLLFFKMLALPNPTAELSFSIVEAVVEDSGVPNAVAGLIFRNRLYDTIFEVVVFTLAILGAQFLLANEAPSRTVAQLTVLSVITLAGGELPPGALGALLSGGIIPWLNLLVALKVALRSWAILLTFIRYRGLL